MGTIIETKNLTKYYGKTRGVKNLNLEVKKGEIFGFLGPNGSGKTTTIRILLHLINPTSGEAFVFGKNVSENYPSILKNIGYLPEDLNLYEKMTGEQLLKFASAFYKKDDLENLKRKVIDRLECEMTTRYRNLSKGNKQKIGILLAIFHKPKLLILDEPTVGLDPLTKNEFYRILFDLNKEGITIFFSSHNLPEVERVCDRIGIMRDGNLVDVETIEELRAHRRKIVEIHFQESCKKDEFESLEGVKIIEAKKDYLYLYATNAAINPLLKLLTSYKIKDIDFSYPDLEKVFLKYYEK